MAPAKGKKPKSTPQNSGPPGTTTTTPQTIGEIHQATYLASRPYQVLFEKKGWNGLSADEKTAYTNFRLLESGAYEQWSAQEQKDFLKYCEKLKIPHPLPKPASVRVSGEEVVFRQQRRKIASLSPDEYSEYKAGQRELSLLWSQSGHFRERARTARAEARERPEEEAERAGTAPTGRESEEIRKLRDLFVLAEKKLGASFRPVTGPVTEEERDGERSCRIRIAELEGKKMPGIYEGDPLWDDVVPIPQDDGEKPLAAIAYTDEYAEAISYLRAIIATREYSPRALSLTAHIIDLNPAHYTVWLFRASTLFALHSSLTDELQWVNSVALANEKNYQIWHHRQLLIDALYPRIAADSRAAVLALARSETAFMAQMFARDSKNYHVWSYRQYLVRKLDLFPSQCTAAADEDDGHSELATVDALLDSDVRNNSAWAHRFFIVFSDPGHSTPSSPACAHDPLLPSHIIDAEIAYAQEAIRRAPMNQSGWNYVRGVLRKGGRDITELEGFAAEFVVWGPERGKEEEEGGAGEGKKTGEGPREGKEIVKSTHALELLADVWTARGENHRADTALRLLEVKYDRVRRNYWAYRREGLTDGAGTGDGDGARST